MTLTRVIVGTEGASGGSGITEGEHEILDTLVHKLAETSFLELAYSGKDLIRATTWTSAGMTLKIREATFTYTSGDLTGVVVQQFNGAGGVVTTLTKTLAYSGKDLVSVTTVRS